VFSRSYGSGVDRYWLYEPDQPKPQSAPVIALLHGWTALDPSLYRGWIRHLARKGYIVIFPQYQELWTPFWQFQSNAINAIRNALDRLQTEPGHVRPETRKFAVMGHSVGGVLTANIGAVATSRGLPQPRVLIPVEPGGVSFEDLSQIPSRVGLLVIRGEEDTVVPYSDSWYIWDQTSQIPNMYRDFVTVRSDYYGAPDLVADHTFPLAGSGSLNALDYYGLWKLSEALCNCAFSNEDCSYALGGGPEMTYMGLWSDGQPVIPLDVTDNPPPP
jgi:dienelactone hydrolase